MRLRLPATVALLMSLSLVLAACGGGGGGGGGQSSASGGAGGGASGASGGASSGAAAGGGGGSSSMMMGGGGGSSTMMGGSTGMSTGMSTTMDQAASSGTIAPPSGPPVAGEIAVQGSSTVQPITQAVGEAFARDNPDARISVGGAGTGDGFEIFCQGETQISDASRPIEAEEAAACEENGVEFVEIPVAYDGISFVVNPQGNNWATDITSEELQQVWEPGSQVDSWDDIRQDYPPNPLGPAELFGPGAESGTFDFFAEEIADPEAEEPALRNNYQASENDNQLVEGVAGNPNALGFFGYSYYENNRDVLQALELDGVAPTTDTIRNGEYPLSRPLFIYVSTQALQENEAVEPFVQEYLANLDTYVEQAQYVTLPGSLEQESIRQFQDQTTGTVFSESGDPQGGDLETALRQSQ